MKRTSPLIAALSMMCACMSLSLLFSANKVYTYKCNNSNCGHIEQWDNYKTQYPCDKCKMGNMILQQKG